MLINPNQWCESLNRATTRHDQGQKQGVMPRFCCWKFVLNVGVGVRNKLHITIEICCYPTNLSIFLFVIILSWKCVTKGTVDFVQKSMLKTRCSCRCLALVLKILLLQNFFRVAIANLDLYVTKDHLKNNLSKYFIFDYIVYNIELAIFDYSKHAKRM